MVLRGHSWRCGSDVGQDLSLLFVLALKNEKGLNLSSFQSFLDFSLYASLYINYEEISQACYYW